MNSLPSCKSEVSPRFLLLSPPSPSPPLILSSLILLQQKLVWVSRLGWPRTKISETRFFSKSISKLIIWSRCDPLAMSWLGTNGKKTRAPSFSSDRRSAYRPSLCSPMMSYADNEPGGRHNASLTCVCFSHSTRCAPQHHLSSSAGTNNTHEAIFRSHRSFRSLAELWVISSQSP